MLIENGAVNPALIALIRLQGLVVSDESPRAVNDLLQKEWVKAKDGKFRADLGGRFSTDEEYALLNPIGAAAVPIDFSKPYLGACLLGATLKAVTRRTQFLLNEEAPSVLGAPWQTLPSPLYLLGSTRVLDQKQEMLGHVQAILEETGADFNTRTLMESAHRWPQNEIEMMEQVVLNWIHPLPYEPDRVVSIAAPDGVKPDGTPRPANTAETVKQFMKDAPPGQYLIVSSQPFCDNQIMAVRRAAKESGIEGFTFDVCGPSAPPLQLSRWLDNLAKQLWEEVQLMK